MHDRQEAPVARAGGMLARTARLIDSVRGGRGGFFTFHRAAPRALWPTLPNRDFYLDLAYLDNLLSYLAASGRKVVTVEEGLRLAADPATRDTFVNFSIDDCYRDTYELVVPLFRRHGVPITLFVTTGIPDGTVPLWWVGLEETIHQRDFIEVDGQRIETDTTERKMATYLDLQWRWDGERAASHYARFCKANGVDAEALHWRHAITWDMLAELAHDPLVEIGSHTVSHARISALSPEVARDELCQSRHRLAERLGIPITHFAFPYGRAKDCGPRDFDIARQAGYVAVGTTTKGILHVGSTSYTYPRITINGAHQNNLFMELHLAGASAIAARLLGRV